jgi:hypothetical protein
MKSLLGGHHRRTPSTEAMLATSAPSEICTPDKLTTTAEEDAIEPGGGDHRAGNVSSPSMGLTHGNEVRSPQTGFTTAADAGKQAALQRERALHPKAALEIITNVITPAKKVSAPPIGDGGSATKARWSFGWGGRPTSRPPSVASSCDSAREGSAREGEEEFESDPVRRAGKIEGDTSIDEAVEAGHVRRGGKIEDGRTGAESADEAAQAAVLSAIEQNQLEQEGLRKALHAKQTELTALLAQHATLLKRQMEREQPEEPRVNAAPATNPVHVA